MPGKCCSGFHLNSPAFDKEQAPTALHAMTNLQTIEQPHVDGVKRTLPFRPLFIDSVGRWRWWCPELTREGRCGTYETRPSLCDWFSPGSDPLCIMYRPKVDVPVEQAA